MVRLLTADMADNYIRLCKKYDQIPLELYICGDWLSHYDKLKLREACEKLELIIKDITSENL